MNYQAAIDYLYSFIDSEAQLPRRPAEFNLPRTSALLAAIGNPQDAFPSVVIAGTKGKGSTAVMLEALLRAAGYRTGLWTSPHLHSYRERIQVNRELISQDAFIALVEQVQPTLDTFDTEAHGTPSVFEIGFLMALRHFAQQQIDVAVLEVGLGGRYDTANAVTPVLSIITSISYDHTQILGATLGEIAYQKAGIAKPGVPLLTTRQEPAAMHAIAQVTGEVGTPLFIAAAPGEQPPDAPHAQRLEVYVDDLPLGLPGPFQHQNARLAVAATQLLSAQFDISQTAIERGLATATWPGRFEIRAGEPTIVLDGAHNGDSALRLVEALTAYFPDCPVVLVFGTTRDKDVTAMFAALVPIASAIVLTHSQHPRAETNLAGLAAQITQQRPELLIKQTESVPQAIEDARNIAEPGAVICITGSLFLVGAAREALGLAEERD